MSWNPNSVFYSCIAKDTTVLAEFNSKDADLADLAKKCLDKTPSYHSIFSHTVNGETYMFFISDPFVYFGIFDESLEKSECLLFLKSVKEAFTSMIDNCNSGTMKHRLFSPNSHCFQGEFGLVFHQLLASNSEFDRVSSPAGLKDYHRGSLDPVRRKKRFNKEGAEEDNPEVFSDDDVSVSRPQRGRNIWKKQVMVVLSLDLFVCAGLFVIWLWVCNGFQCVAN